MDPKDYQYIPHAGKVNTTNRYTAAIPEDGQVRPEIRDFFAKFYGISDYPYDHEMYAAQFTKEGKLIMGPNEANGREGMCPSAGLRKMFRFRPSAI